MLPLQLLATAVRSGRKSFLLRQRQGARAAVVATTESASTNALVPPLLRASSRPPIARSPARTALDSRRREITRAVSILSAR